MDCTQKSFGHLDSPFQPSFKQRKKEIMKIKLFIPLVVVFGLLIASCADSYEGAPIKGMEAQTTAHSAGDSYCCEENKSDADICPFHVVVRNQHVKQSQ